MRKTLWLLIMVSWGSVTLSAFGFMQALPDELKDRPAEDQLRWLNAEFEQAYTLQLKVAQERHDARMGRKDLVVQTLADQAFEREALITEAEKVTREELESVARQSNAALGGLVAVAVLLGVVAWWQWGRSVDVEVTQHSVAAAHEARSQTQEVLNALSQKSHRRPNAMARSRK